MSRAGFAALAVCLGTWPAGGVQAQPEKLAEASLDDLLDLKISTAARYEQTAREAPASVTIVTAEDIERYGYHTLEDVFQRVRGFYVSNDRNYSYVGMRGFGRPTDYNNRLLLLLNGRPINENIWGGATTGTGFGLDLQAVERIEVVRGPGSALYGTHAMFAVVNVITKTGNAIDGLDVSAQMGSYGTLAGAAIYGKELDNGVDLSISGQWGDSDGQDLSFPEYAVPETNNGVARNLDWEKHYGVFTRVTKDEFSVQAHFASRETGVPTGAYETIFNDDRAKTLDAYAFAELRYDRELGIDKNLVLRTSLNHYHYRGRYPYEALLLERSAGDWLVGEAQFRWDLRSNNRLIVGAEYQEHLRAEYRTWDSEAVYFDGDGAYRTSSYYIQDEYQPTDKLSLISGVRQDRYSTVGTTTSPRGALVYHPGESATLKLLYGEAFRAANMYEINYTDFNFKPNPELEPETIRTVEAVWEQRFGSQILGTVSVYDYAMKNLIDQVLDPADELIQHRNVSRVDTRGMEAELSARMKGGLGAYASYALQRAEDGATKKKLTNSPSHILKLGLSRGFSGYFGAAAEARYESGRTTVYGTRTQPYLLTNLQLSAAPRTRADSPLASWMDHVRVSFLVRNVLDVAYATPGGVQHLQPAIPQNGRDLLARVDWLW